MFVDADMEFRWTEEEVADLYDNTKIIVAADGRLCVCVCVLLY